MAAAILGQQQPDSTIYYDHSKSPHQWLIGANQTLEAVRRPGDVLLNTLAPPSNCQRQKCGEHARASGRFISRNLGRLISEGRDRYQTHAISLQQKLKCLLLLDAMFQAICPIVVEFWQLAPDLQARSDAVK